MPRFVVARSKSEAQTLADEDYGTYSREEAEALLAECKAPPIDSFYGNQLHIYEVKVHGEEKTKAEAQAETKAL